MTRDDPEIRSISSHIIVRAVLGKSAHLKTACTRLLVYPIQSVCDAGPTRCQQLLNPSCLLPVGPNVILTQHLILSD